MVLNQSNIINCPPSKVIAAGTNKNLMQAGLEQEEPTLEEITDTLLAFANNDRKLFTGRSRRNLLQGGTFRRNNIKQAGTTEEEQTFERINKLLSFGRFS
jgi:hypothetical protein